MDMKRIEIQRAEFDAVVRLIETYRRQPAIVDNDYPEWRHDYEGSINELLRACVANGRGRALLGDVRGDAITLDAISAVNLARCLRWHPAGINSWSLSDWAVALAGEVGELCNVVKKMNRVRDGLIGNKVPSESLRPELADEIGDVYAYLDLFAQALGVRLQDCVRNKFNRVSERCEFPERL